MSHSACFVKPGIVQEQKHVAIDGLHPVIESCQPVRENYPSHPCFLICIPLNKQFGNIKSFEISRFGCFSNDNCRLKFAHLINLRRLAYPYTFCPQHNLPEWAYLKVVSSLTSLHYLWRSLGPFSLPCSQM